MGKKNKKGVRLVKLNWDEECKLDLMLGRGFLITEPAIITALLAFSIFPPT